ncbi:MAG: class F sortase, partial [Microbacteriaceae bacterium]
HVDSPSGPAVFVRLRDLVPGDAVEVTDAAGTVHRYSVVEVADYPKTAFPTARVFGAVLDDQLRLITCGGVFDRSVGSYEDNRVVYAVRADA